VRVGLISDTHSLLRPQCFEVFKDVDLIVHLGDICKPEILNKLRTIAPVKALCGNCDRGAWTASLLRSDSFLVEGLLVYALHDLEKLDIDPSAAGVGIILHGHTHIPSHEQRNGIHYINPGGAGLHRFTLPVTIAVLEVSESNIDLQFTDLETNETHILDS